MNVAAVKLETPEGQLDCLSWGAPLRTYGVYVLKSQCGCYSIHAEKVEGRWRYEALVRTDVWNNVIGWFWSKEDAIAACEKHIASGNSLNQPLGRI